MAEMSERFREMGGKVLCEESEEIIGVVILYVV